MTPIVCVGETLEEREAGHTDARVDSQIRAAFAGVRAAGAAVSVVAYEPIWAIGTGRNATPEDAQAMCRTIRHTVAEHAGKEVAESLRVQYGGSCTPANAPDLLTQPDVDGALVGGASLDPDSFARIVESAPKP
jgi:triosephosphate isomerase